MDSFVSVDCKGLVGALVTGTSLLAKELTEKVGRIAVSESETATTMTEDNTA